MIKYLFIFFRLFIIKIINSGQIKNDQNRQHHKNIKFLLIFSPNAMSRYHTMKSMSFNTHITLFAMICFTFRSIPQFTLITIRHLLRAPNTF